MNGQYRKNTIIPAFLALFQKLWGTNLFVLLCAYTILLWIMKHPFLPFRSPIFAHPSPPLLRSRTPSYTLFTLFNVPASAFLLPVKRKVSESTWPFFSIFNDFSDPCAQRLPISAGAADTHAACGALPGGLPWEPVHKGMEKAPGRSDLTLPFDSLFGTRSARFG